MILIPPILKVLLDLTSKRDQLISPLISPHSEYAHIVKSIAPGDSAIQWINYSASSAALQIIHCDDSWHDFVTSHFRPDGQLQDFELAGITVHHIRPSTYCGNVYRGNAYNWIPATDPSAQLDLELVEETKSSINLVQLAPQN